MGKYPEVNPPNRWDLAYELHQDLSWWAILGRVIWIIVLNIFKDCERTNVWI